MVILKHDAFNLQASDCETNGVNNKNESKIRISEVQSAEVVAKKMRHR